MGQVYGNIHKPAADELRTLLGLTAFVETGTFHGETVAWAMDKFPQVFSMDIWRDMITSVSEKVVKGHKGVTLIHGDSRKELPRICKLLKDTPTLFWLDAHYAGINQTYDPLGCSLAAEITAINEHFIGTHAILIDDYAAVVSKDHDAYFSLLWQASREVAVFDDIVLACSQLPPARSKFRIDKKER